MLSQLHSRAGSQTNLRKCRADSHDSSLRKIYLQNQRLAGGGGSLQRTRLKKQIPLEEDPETGSLIVSARNREFGRENIAKISCLHRNSLREGTGYFRAANR